MVFAFTLSETWSAQQFSPRGVGREDEVQAPVQFSLAFIRIEWIAAEVGSTVALGCIGVSIFAELPRRDSPNAPSARRRLRDSRLDFTLPAATSLISQAREDEFDSPNVLGAQMPFRGECYPVAS